MFSTDFLDLPPLTHAHGTVVLPGSKSISNRVLLLAALSQGTTTVHDLLDSDDTQVMLTALAATRLQDLQTLTNSIEINGLGDSAVCHLPSCTWAMQVRRCDL